MASVENFAGAVGLADPFLCGGRGGVPRLGGGVSAVGERCDEAEVGAAGGVPGDEPTAASDDDDASDFGEGADGGGDAPVQGELVGAVAGAAEGKAAEGFLEPVGALVFEGGDGGGAEVVFGGDALDQLIVPEGPVQVGGVDLVQSFDQAGGEGAAAGAGLAANGNERRRRGAGGGHGVQS